MPKLSFEYDDKSGESVAHYRGLKIRAANDSDASNPWESDDGLSPLLAYSDSWLDYTGVDDIESPLTAEHFSDYRLGRDWRKLCSALDCDAAELEREAKESQRGYGGRLADIRRELLERELSDKRPSGGRSWSSACDYLDSLESLWQMAGVAALDFQRNGYSQGDSVRGLLVATPRWRAAMGIKPAADMAADLNGQADLFGQWAFGDCYGWIIEDSDGETLDSCWGFYGSDFDKSGLAESALEVAESILASARKRRCGRLAELIRNRVPLGARPALLAEAGALSSAFC